MLRVTDDDDEHVCLFKPSPATSSSFQSFSFLTDQCLVGSGTMRKLWEGERKRSRPRVSSPLLLFRLFFFAVRIKNSGWPLSYSNKSSELITPPPSPDSLPSFTGPHFWSICWREGGSGSFEFIMSCTLKLASSSLSTFRECCPFPNKRFLLQKLLPV